MNTLRVSKRIHIMPLGYEQDRIVEPAIRYDADEVILLEPGPDDDEYHRPAYHEEVRDELEDAGIDVRTEFCNIFDLYDSIGTIAELGNGLVDEGHIVFVNLASGSKVTSIGGMIACMATGASPYYVRAESYAGGDEAPVAIGVKEIEPLPEYHIRQPDSQLIVVLKYINENGPLTKQDLIAFGKEQELPFISRYDHEGVKNPDRGFYRRLNSQIISPLFDRDFIEVEKHSKYQYVTITETGSNQLRAFHYLLHK